MDIPLAVAIGLVASFVQSLGLTLQRRSHLKNERLPERERRSEWHRPLWIVGFAVFLSANISGTIFQIGSLPVVILAPLGAVSLLYNALLARVMLNDFLSLHMLRGTLLIATGAVSIGYFGAVPQRPRPLGELLLLYSRPQFVAVAMLMFLVFASLLSMAHLTEWQLMWQTRGHTRRMRRRFQSLYHFGAPSLAPVAEASKPSSGANTPPASASRDERVHLLDDSLRTGSTDRTRELHGTLPYSPASDRSGQAPPSPSPSYDATRAPAPDYGAIAQKRRPHDTNLRFKAACHIPQPNLDSPAVRSTVIALAVAYSSTSGTLSGVCLLLAKSGVDLLLLSLRGNNQFGHWASWSLVVVMLVAALLQLWYLHKSLKLADPVLICPLAFCFYNVSSILLSLVYFDELAQLSWVHITMVFVGTALLLCGVWIISLHRAPGTDPEQIEEDETWGPGWHDAGADDRAQTVLDEETFTDEPATLSDLPVLPRRSAIGRATALSSRHATISLDHALNEGLYTHDHAHITQERQPTLYGILVERGLSIGLSPSSPGFHVQARRRPETLAARTRRRSHGDESIVP